MSHSSLTHWPVLEYHGQCQAADGSFPGPCYRMVALGLVGLGLVNRLTAPEDLWSNEPLGVRVPVALALGYSTWKVVIEGDWPAGKLSQAPRRVFIQKVHALRCPLPALRMVCENYMLTHDLDGTRKELLDAGSPPHGLAVLGPCGSERAMTQSTTVRTAPLLVKIPSFGPNAPLLFELRQAACGRHFGEEIKLIAPLSIGQPTTDQGSGVLLTLPPQWECPVSDVPLEPLDDSLLAAMLDHRYPP